MWGYFDMKLCRKIRLISVLLCIVLLLSGFTLGNSGKYKKAQKYFNEGDYSRAEALFAEITTYEDSNRYLMYARAILLAEQGNYELAVNSFAALEDFLDSKLQATYYQACLAEASLCYDEAESLYTSIITFRDCAERLNEMYYQRGLAAESALNYASAYFYFKQAGEYKDSAAKAVRFENDYNLAKSHFEEGRYSEAAEIFVSLYNYSDAAVRALESYYKYGMALFTENHYKEALAAFENAAGYLDSDAHVQKLRCLTMDAGDLRREISQNLTDACRKLGIMASIDPNQGSFAIENDVLFDPEQDTLTSVGKYFLDSIVPCYLDVLLQSYYSERLTGILIKAYVIPPDTSHIDQELSEEYAQLIAEYCLNMPNLTEDQKEALQLLMTAKSGGYSYIINASGEINTEASNRVELCFLLSEAE